MSTEHSTTASADPAEYKKEMHTRHIVMLALGGVIGTGLFLTSGYTVNQAGPLGAVIAYIVGAVMVYLVMVCLGELAVQMPETGSFSSYATRYLGPGTGYTVAWLYWLTWAVAIGSEFTAAGILMVRWFPDTPVWIWSAFFAITVFILNVVSVRLFAETEFWLSLIKVLTVIAFIVIGAGAICGLFEVKHVQGIGLSNFTREGLFPTGLLPIAMTLLAVSFAFSGTELIGIAAGEAKDPQDSVPKAIRTTVVRLALFFVGTIVVLATLLPREQAGLVESPFVMVFDMIGIPYSADIMNFVILTALLSAANSGLYAASRMLWTLSDQGHMPKCFRRLSPRGTPVNAIILSMAGAVASLLSSVVAPDTVYLALVSVSGLAVVVVWMSIAASQIAFRRHYVANGGRVEDLHFRVRGYPWVPLGAILCCVLACVGIAFDPEQRVALYFGLPFIAWCYFVYWVTRKKREQRLAAMLPVVPGVNAT
ncbi:MULTISPECIES: amino acid permease [unclassified Pseudomonas]|uniref:amino acid permease n=1 Tax=unclassified Pseudomonas TaxID=196821 RepID=UPI000BA2D9BA|nr:MULTISPECIES: amino acid permease [unclassified Pseudomonas]MCU1723148.1 amino acid permease [Pseudomonas sp. 5P_5.1_Bac1]MCU1734609.1 amino acid permease [Pseudomonas sp. 20P_3.2_Bac4]MCU1747506.1 amino acid permease [Pseudomonas sp. 20P_3.2_Bac5]